MKNKGDIFMMNKLERRIIDISYKKGLSHIGSCLSVVKQIDAIFQTKKRDEPFVLSNAHSSLALYVVLEKYGYGDAEKLFDRHGVHCNRDIEHGIWVSGGSLGCAISICVGLALANRDRLHYCMISDGETNEGAVFESLRIATEQRLENLRILLMANSWGAYGKIDLEYLRHRILTFYPLLIVETNLFDWPSWLNGLEGHYHVMTKSDYEEITKNR